MTQTNITGKYPKCPTIATKPPIYKIKTRLPAWRSGSLGLRLPEALLGGQLKHAYYRSVQQISVHSFDAQLALCTNQIPH